MLNFWRGRFDQYSEEWLFRLSWARAVEWCGLPLFVAQPIAPIFLVYFPAWAIIGAVIVLSWAWRLIRYRLLGIRLVEHGELWPGCRPSWRRAEYRSPMLSPLNLVRLADAAQWVVHLKWPISIGAAIILFQQQRPVQGMLAGFWPIATWFLIWIGGGGGLVGVVQKRFLLALGFIPLSGDPGTCSTDDFHRPGL